MALSYEDGDDRYYRDRYFTTYRDPYGDYAKRMEYENRHLKQMITELHNQLRYVENLKIAIQAPLGTMPSERALAEISTMKAISIQSLMSMVEELKKPKREELNTGVENKKKMLQPLSDLSNLIQRTFNAQTKTLYRAGYLTSDLNVTKKLTDALGEMFVGHIIDGSIAEATLPSFAAELVKRAEEEIAEAEKQESK